MPATTYTLEPVAQAICLADNLTFGGAVSQGAFKETFLAIRPDREKLALKVLRPGCSPERSEREVQAMQKCHHPNIVSLVALDQITVSGSDYVYLLEKFMDGGTLEDRLTRNGLLKRADGFTLACQLIPAIAEIADNDLVHRDLKPANILFDAPEGNALIADFGIVRDLRQDSLTKSFVMHGPGTPYFAAPEQLNNEKALIDWRTDQFALGVTLSVALFGFHPYQNDGQTVVDAITRVASRRGPSDKFLAACKTAKLEALQKVVSPWPVERFRQPATLMHAWLSQSGEA